MKNENLYTISAIGKDLTGLVSLMTSVLYELNCNIIDIQQSVVHGYFSIFIITDATYLKTGVDNLSKKILEVGNQANLKIIFEKFQEGRRKPDKKLMSAVLIGKDRPGIVAETTSIFGYYAINIECIRMIARGSLFIMEMLVDISDSSAEIEIVQSRLKEMLNKIEVGILFQSEKDHRKSKKLIIFDVSTALIEKNILSELLQNDRFKSCFDRYGKIKNNEADIKSQALLLKGIKSDLFDQITDKIEITADGEEIIRDLKDFNYKIALISTKFRNFTDKIKSVLSLDYAFGNILSVGKTDSCLTGEIEEPIIDGNKKNDIIGFICQSECVTKSDIITIGDQQDDDIFLKSPGIFISLKQDFIAYLDKVFNEKKISEENLAGIICSLGLYEQ